MTKPTGRLLFAYNTITELNKRIAELEKERDECHAMVVYMGAIMDESEGVAGYHLNGDIAKWDDLFTVPLYENALQAHNLEQQAKGVREALTKAKWRGGSFLHECLFEDYIHDLQTQAETLKGQGDE